jgi:nucleoside-diphosphate-sugar epimerase
MPDRCRVLVTGGAGFIGRGVVHALLAAGHEVTVADLQAFGDPEVRSVTGDLCHPGVAERAVTAARAIGYEPALDLETGMATVWPDFRLDEGAR